VRAPTRPRHGDTSKKPIVIGPPLGGWFEVLRNTALVSPSPRPRDSEPPCHCHRFAGNTNFPRNRSLPGALCTSGCRADLLIGSICRKCLDQLIIFNERHLRRVLSKYFNATERVSRPARTARNLACSCSHLSNWHQGRFWESTGGAPILKIKYDVTLVASLKC
jgi:hypothetical protein